MSWRLRPTRPSWHARFEVSVHTQPLDRAGSTCGACRPAPVLRLGSVGALSPENEVELTLRARPLSEVVFPPAGTGLPPAVLVVDTLGELPECGALQIEVWHSDASRWQALTLWADGPFPRGAAGLAPGAATYRPPCPGEVRLALQWPSWVTEARFEVELWWTERGSRDLWDSAADSHTPGGRD